MGTFNDLSSQRNSPQHSWSFEAGGLDVSMRGGGWAGERASGPMDRRMDGRTHGRMAGRFLDDAWLVESVGDRSVGRSAGRSLGRSIGRSIGRSVSVVDNRVRP